jgi:hypothetical protein
MFLSSEDKVFFHIGLPKCASTTLQKHLFCNLETIQNFGLYPINNIAGSNKVGNVKNAVFLENPQLFQFYKLLHNNRSVSDDELHSLWKEVVQTSRDEKYLGVLLSHEAMTSHFFSTNTQQEKARRIHSLFPEAEILIVIRNQEDWLRSQYTDHPFDPHKLGSGSPLSFDEWVDTFLNSEALVNAREALCYSKLISNYADLFGASQIHVAIFEDLVHQPKDFYHSLASYLGVSDDFIAHCLSKKHENRGLSHLYNVARQSARAKKSKVTLADKIRSIVLGQAILKTLPKKKYPLRSTTLQQLSTYYGKENEKISKQVLIDAYDYPGMNRKVDV